jgi:hypothetical protein
MPPTNASASADADASPPAPAAPSYRGSGWDWGRVECEAPDEAPETEAEVGEEGVLP